MTCRIVAGSSGCGKSYQVYQRMIADSMLHPQKHYFVLVPEQFTMQTQADLLAMHPGKALMNIDILSFQRLAYRIFGEVGGNTQPILEDMGKTMILQKLVREQQNHLTVLKGTLSRGGAVEQMKSLVSELIQYQAPPEKVEEWGKKTDSDALKQKLQDVSLLYRSFLDYLRDNYLTAEEVPEVLCGVIDRSQILKDAVVIMDGFTGFTPMQEEIISHLLKLCREVCLIVTAREGTALLRPQPSHALFYMSSCMAGSMVRLARQSGTELLPLEWIRAGEKSRFSEKPALAYLEQNLFRSGAAAYEERQDVIRIRTAANPSEEIQLITEEIRRLVREEGYRYRDIAVITADMDSYGREAQRSFAGADIPLFIDKKYPVLDNAFVEFIRSAVDMVRTGCTYASVFRFLRCGLGPLPEAETDLLENYVLAVGIRGWKQYEQEWTRLPLYMRTGAKEEEQQTALAELNAIRSGLTEQMRPFVEGLRERRTTLRRKTDLLMDLIEGQELCHKVRRLEEKFAEKGQKTREREYAQIYRLVLDLLEKSVEVLGEEKMGLEAWQQILEAGFCELRMGLIPPGNDQVMLGDIERTRLKNIRILFFAGVNEGLVPRRSSNASILSERDRELLQGMDVELSPTARDEIYRQRFYLYLLLTKPSDRLYVSYSRSSAGKKSLAPSYLIAQLEQLFPQAGDCQQGEKDLFRPETEHAQLELFLQGLRKLPEGQPENRWLELYAWYRKEPERSRRLDRMLDAAALEKPEGSIGKAAAEALYGRELRGSVSRLESYARCAFAHFLQYGLKVREREEADFSPADMGTVIHDALSRFSRKLLDDGVEWSGLETGERERRVDLALQKSAEEYGKNSSFAEDGRGKWVFKRIRNLLHCTVWALQEQLRAGDFSLADTERPFLEVYPLDGQKSTDPEGRKMILRGQIDRLDLCEDGDRMLVKVIDYKTGAKELSLSDFYDGLQLQLVVYLKAASSETARAKGKACEPAGIFYYKVTDPYVAAESDTEVERLKELRPDGMLRDEPEIVEHFDKNLAPSMTSVVIPVRTNKYGSPTAASPVYSVEDFAGLQDFADRKLREMSREILDGNTEILPYRKKDRTGCDYCQYRDICGFDLQVPGFGYRRLQSRKNSDMMNLIREETYGE